MMEKFISYEKLSKKEKRKRNLAKRNTWGELNPVTRKPESNKVYNRNKYRKGNRDGYDTNSGAFIFWSHSVDQEVAGVLIFK